MITFEKGMYPELTKDDFEKHVTPLLECMNEYSFFTPVPLTFHEVSLAREEYPFHLLCKAIATGLWKEIWDPSLEPFLESPLNFCAASCDELAQLAAQNMVRSFVEDVKRHPGRREDPREQYSDYEQFTLANEFVDFSNQYPIIWSRTTELLRHRARAIIEVVTIVTEHRAELVKIFGIPLDARIRAIDSTGDTHNNGRAVALIEFEDRSKVVFKPRAVSGEAGFARLVCGLSKILGQDLPSLRVLDLGKYGFTAYLTQASHEPDLHQVGRLACLMYMLDAIDMHYTNIMWTSEGAVCIDLESLFHPTRVRVGKTESSSSAYNALHRSVYGTGVLPMIISSQKNTGSIDVGFAGSGEQYGSSPFRDYKVLNPFSSEIRVVWEPAQEPPSPVDDAAARAFVNQACKQVETGFLDTYRRIMEHRDDFIALVLTSFEGAELRYIHNPTVKYIQLLRTLTGPEASRSLTVAKGLLSRAVILSVSSDPAIVEAECEQLWQGDVPYFNTQFEHNGVYHRNQKIATLATSPRQAFLEKMTRLGEEDMAFQARLIRLAFVAKLTDPHANNRFALTSDDVAERSQTVCRDSSRDAVAASLRELVTTLSARIKDDRYDHLPRTWIGPVARFGSGQWSPGVLGYDLYSGRVGPAMALAIAGEILGDHKAAACAESVFDRAAEILGDATYELRSVLASGTGAFSGVSGLLWAMHASGRVAGNQEWIRQAKSSWELLPEKMFHLLPTSFDMISGDSASLIMRLRSTGKLPVTPDIVESWVAAARSRILSEGPNLPSGLAHGIGQIIWFFSSIDATHGNTSSRNLVGELVQLIESEYRTGNGPTQLYRNFADKHSDSWCNGIAGLLVAFGQAHKAGLIERERVVDLIHQLEIVEIGAPPVLCHGALGSAQVLRDLEPVFPEATPLRSGLEETWCSPSQIVEYFRTEQGRYALSPGLMSGRAGAALQLSHRLEPGLVPSPSSLRFGDQP